MWSQETREGVIGRYEFNANNSLVSAQFTPVIIENYSTPRLANKKESERILNRMKEERN